MSFRGLIAAWGSRKLVETRSRVSREGSLTGGVLSARRRIEPATLTWQE